MASQPIRINARPYAGRDSTKRLKAQLKAEVAQKIEDYINERHQRGQQQFDYFEIANDLQIQKDVIFDILRFNRGGSNGITFGEPE